MGVLMRPELRIDPDRLRANIGELQRRVHPADVMIVVKDDAYGHGARWVARAAVAAGLEWIGTYDIRTAVALRDTVGAAPRLFAWATSGDDEIVEGVLSGIDLGVGTPEYLERIISVARRLGARARIHLKIDTGLHRNGFAPDEWEQGVHEALQAQEAGHVELVGAWSHLAEASDAEDDDAAEIFRAAVDAARAAGADIAHTHLTASAATWARPELRGDLVRVGAFCYGIRSADGPELPGIAPVARLVADTTAVDGDEAVIGVGSFDGLPSILAGRIDVGTPDGPCRLLAVEADSCRVRAWPGARVGDEVVVFGPGDAGESSATTLAEAVGTVGEEILTRLSPRVRRVHG